TGFDPAEGVSNGRLLQRVGLLSSLDRLDQHRAPVANMQRCQERALDMVTGPRARRAFDLSGEDPRLRERYGLHPLGQNLLLSRRLVEAGVRLVGVNAWAGVAPGDKFIATMAWDMHGAAVQGCGIFDSGTLGLGFVLPRFDQAVSALLEDLGAR